MGVKIEPGCCVGNPKAKGGLMHLKAKGRRSEGVRCIKQREALDLQTQLPGEVLMAIIAEKVYLSVRFLRKVPLTCGNKASLEGCLHNVAMTAREGKN